MEFERTLADQRRLIVNADRKRVLAVNDILEKLETLDRKGPRLDDGVTIDFGCSRFTIRRKFNGPILYVHEPDLLNDPMVDTVPHVDLTLAMIERQKSMLELTDEEPVEVRFDQTVLVERGVFEKRKIYLERLDSVSPQDSGWYIGSAEDADAENKPGEQDLDTVPLMIAAKFRRDVLDVISLPVGYLAIYEYSALVGLQRPSGEILDV